jgi:DNA-binding XRE family transcriptional regulator
MSLWAGPPPTIIGRTRSHLGQTQREAGLVVSVSERAWQDWERGVAEMPVAAWELYLMRAGVLTVNPPTRDTPAWLSTEADRTILRRVRGGG